MVWEWRGILLTLLLNSFTTLWLNHTHIQLSALILRASNLILYHSVRVERGCQQWFAMTHLLHYTGLHIGTVLAENHKWLTVALHSGRITHIPICLHSCNELSLKQTSYYDGGVERGCY